MRWRHARSHRHRIHLLQRDRKPPQRLNNIPHPGRKLAPRRAVQLAPLPLMRNVEPGRNMRIRLPKIRPSRSHSARYDLHDNQQRRPWARRQRRPEPGRRRGRVGRHQHINQTTLVHPHILNRQPRPQPHTPRPRRGPHTPGHPRHQQRPELPTLHHRPRRQRHDQPVTNPARAPPLTSHHHTFATPTPDSPRSATPTGPTRPSRRPAPAQPRRTADQPHLPASPPRQSHAPHHTSATQGPSTVASTRGPAQRSDHHAPAGRAAPTSPAHTPPDHERHSAR